MIVDRLIKYLTKNRVVTSDPGLITEIHGSSEYTRSAISRRMVEQNGARFSMVSQSAARAKVKRSELKKFLNNGTNNRVLKSSLSRLHVLLSENATGQKIDLLSVIKSSVQYGFLEEFLGIELTQPLKDQISEIGIQRSTFEESHRRLGMINYLPLPMMIRDMFSPTLRKKNEKFHQLVSLIYASGAEKSGSWLEHLKMLERYGVLTHDEVLGEIRAIFISANTLTNTIVWAIFRLSINDHGVHVPKLLANDDYARFCYMEALRLHPPFETISYEKHNKCPFHRNNLYMVEVKRVQRDPIHWESPDNFEPARFERGLSSITKGSYIPFGGNERKCPGVAMSMTIAPKIMQAFWGQVRVLEVWDPMIRIRGIDLADNNTFYVRMINA